MTELVQHDEAWARRITERIRYTAIAVRDGVEKMQRLVTEAQEGNAHSLLGYASWTAYIADVMGDEPLQLRDREERREVVAWLSRTGPELMRQGGTRQPQQSGAAPLSSTQWRETMHGNPYDPENEAAHQWCSEDGNGGRWFDIGTPCEHPEWHQEDR